MASHEAVIFGSYGSEFKLSLKRRKKSLPAPFTGRLQQEIEKVGNSWLRGPHSVFELGLRQAERALALLPLAAFLQELDAFETLENGTLAADSAGCFQSGVFGHDRG